MVVEKNTSFSRSICVFFLTCIALILGACRNEVDPKPSDISNSDVTLEPSVKQPAFSSSKTDWPHTLSDIKPDPRVVYGRLPNGFRYSILPVPDRNGIVSIKMNVGVGFQDEPKPLYGIAHLLEHMAFRGARGNTQESMRHDMDTIGVAGLNGFTAQDHTYYQARITDYTPKDMGLVLKNMSQLVRAPNLTQESLDAERNVVIAELNYRNTEDARTHDRYLEFLYPNKPRYQSPGIGTMETLSTIALPDVEAFYKAHYQPSNTVIFIAGDVSVKKTKKQIENLFKDWTASETIKPSESELTASMIDTFPPIKAYEDTSKTQINLVQNMLSNQGLDMQDSLKTAFVETIALAMMGERLKPRIDAEDEVSWTRLQTFTHYGQYIRLVKLAARDYDKAMMVFEEERLRALQYGFTETEIALALKKERAVLENRAKDPSKIDSWSDVSSMRQQFNRGAVYISDQQALDYFEKHAKAVSKNDYHKAIKRIWGEFTPRYWGQSYDVEVFDRKVKALKSVREKVSLKTLTPPKALAPFVFEKVEFPKAGKIKSRNIYSDYKINRVLYENGARLNYISRKDERNSLQIIMTLAIDPVTAKQYYAAVSEQAAAFSRADILGVTKLQMDQYFAGREVYFSMGVYDGRLVLSAKTNEADLKDTLDLWATFLETIDLESSDQKKSVKNFAKTIQSVVGSSPLTGGYLKIMRLYSGDSPSFQTNMSGAYNHLDDALSVIKQFVKTGLIEVGVVGDFNPEILEQAFAQSLGALPPRIPFSYDETKPTERVTHIKPGVTNIKHYGNEKQMALFYCWPFKSETDLSHDLTRDLAVEIIGNRITKRLREDLGLTYSPQFYQQLDKAFPEFKYVCFTVQIATEDEKQVHETIKIMIDEIQSQPVTKTELSRARNPMMSRMKSYWTSNINLASIAAYAFSEPERAKIQSETFKKIEKISQKQIEAYVSETFDKKTLHVFRVKHQKLFEDLSRATLETQVSLGYEHANVGYAKMLIASRKKEERVKGWEMIEKMAKEGEVEASFELGRKLVRDRRDYKIAAKYLEVAQEPAEGAFLLAETYLNHPKLFPDISNEKIMALYSQSAGSGYSKGQKALARQYKQGSMIERDLVKALKWALLSVGMEDGLGTNMDMQFIERYTEGLSDAEQEKARESAKAWRQKNPKTF